MNRTDIERYNFPLHESQIAKHPTTPRDSCKLLKLNRKDDTIDDYNFSDIFSLLSDNFVIVLNNTRVMNARVLSKKISGGSVEIFIINILSEFSADVLIKGKIKADEILFIAERVNAIVEDIFYENDTRFARLKFNENIYDIMNSFGITPLPPYIKRTAEDSDKGDYQTVYAKEETSQAAPTAGLHFTEELLSKLKNSVADILELRLDVGLGTFKPVSTQFIEDHKIHKERYMIDKITAKKLNNYKQQGKKILAVGTTVVRALESAADDSGAIQSGERYTDIFITEGYQFKIVDAMITNFHLPRSTLLALVSAFAGYEQTMRSYQHAKDSGYKFFSYGDAMLII